MEVYKVYAKDSYVEINGSMSEVESFGPWFNVEDATKAKEFLSGMEQRSYSGAGRMPRYAWVEISCEEVYDSFDKVQCY